MKDQFSGFYRPSAADFERLWTKGHFSFDANVLLALYRYTADTRVDFLKVIEAIASRLWIPHQAAMEFHRNRAETIMGQQRMFTDVRKIINVNFKTLSDQISNLNLTKRHSLIRPAEFLKTVESANAAFEAELEALEKAQLTIRSEDPMLNELTSLLSGVVGLPFTQQELDGIYREGAIRYEHKTPPGFEDAKEKKGAYEYADRTYERAFGDLILWRQLLRWAKEHHIKELIFVTNDDKRDWWQTVESPTGPQVIGPRPELAAELRALAGVELFYMYPADRFLDQARTALKIDVRSSSVDQVRDVQEFVRSNCPTMYPDSNVYITFHGTTSSRFHDASFNVGETITFRAASLGYDYGCGVHTFSWDFGDGSHATNQSPSHAYAADGTYKVTLHLANPTQSVDLTTSVRVGTGASVRSEG